MRRCGSGTATGRVARAGRNEYTDPSSRETRRACLTAGNPGPVPKALGLRWSFRMRFARVAVGENGFPMRILVAYHIPSQRRLETQWADGFVAGVGLLGDGWNVTWHNVGIDEASQLAPIDSYDFVLAKSGWGWVVDRWTRAVLSGSNVRRGLAISGSRPPPSTSRMAFYDVLFYETEWYGRSVRSHPLTIHAFGINTDTMNESVQRADKRYDWLTVGAVKQHKRQWLILDKPGSKLLVGDLHEADERILERLQARGVEIKDYVSQEELARLYGASRNVYIPATTRGGGERAILEARACGTPVTIEPDNPKLAELVSQPEIWGHRYYGRQLTEGIRAAMAAPSRGRATKARDWALEKIPDRRTVFRHLDGIRTRVTGSRNQRAGGAREGEPTTIPNDREDRRA